MKGYSIKGLGFSRQRVEQPVRLAGG
jgi:hypothetical protein